jgi:hypothetical protein
MLLVAVVFAAAIVAPTLPAGPQTPDEGMWTFDNLPLEHLKQTYNFEPAKEWIEHVRMSAIKYASQDGGGGSASFVSPNGLVMTNHHVALETVHKLSSAEHNYVKDGFSAKAFGKEPKAPGFTIMQLVQIENVTDQVKEATKELTDAAAIRKARAEVVKAAAQKLTDKSKHLVAEPVALYDGGESHIYVYRTYTDVRLVFAPEKQIAFFGGDPDNFTFPRYCYDCAFFRVYEDDKPIDTSKNYFKWSEKGAQNDELIFVPGNPGKTQRLLTYAQMEFERDFYHPIIISILQSNRDALAAVMAKGGEEARQVEAEFFGIENSLKAFKGHLGGLRDPEMMARQKEREADLVKQANDPKVVEAIDAIAGAAKRKGEVFPRIVCCQLPGISNMPLEKFVVSIAKGAKASATGAGFSKLDADDVGQLEARLGMAKKFLPEDDAFIRALGLKDETPKAVVEKLMASKLFEEEFRAELVKGGAEAVEKSTDPLVAAIRASASILDASRPRFRAEIEIENANAPVLNEARFKVYGKALYPDATFTLRLSYGTVKGYEAGTTKVPYKTTLTGLFERNLAFDNAPPFDLPKRWLDKRSDLDLATPMNFVCTADIIGGNSGSPIINKNAEVVGLIFDGNIESLPGNFWYDGRSNRAVGVHSAGIVEGLRKIYGEADLVKELTGS